MKKSGISELPLHGGSAPSWLVIRMKKLAKPIVRIIIDEYGRDGFLERISDPFWFQSLGCVLGYDWHSSGLTTVTTGVLKDIIEPGEIGIFVAGGKGKKSRKTPEEIEEYTKKFGFSTNKLKNLKDASRTSAKIDNAAIQAGTSLYHHTFFGSEDGEWAVVQQGINNKNKLARRYHWMSENIDNFVNEPHNAIISNLKQKNVLNMTSKRSEECRKTSTDLVKDNPRHIKGEFKSLRLKNQKTINEFIPNSKTQKKSCEGPSIKKLRMPKRMNWSALKEAYELQPENYEELIKIRGVGPATVRGLALISEIIYGESANWEDPAKYSYAFGGKDGIPYPVNKHSMNKASNVLKSAIEEAEIDKKEKIKSIKRLNKISKEHPNQNKQKQS